MTIRGTVSDLTSNGDFATFVVRGANGRDVPARASAALLHGLKEGDRVEIEGDLPPDPPFLVRSIAILNGKPDPKSNLWKWLAGAAVAACLVVAVVLMPRHGGAAPAPVPAPGPPIVKPAAFTLPSGHVQLLNPHSGLCLSPAGGGREANGEIVQFTCDGDPSRFWSFTVVHDDIVKVRNVNSDLCLTVAGGSNDRNVVSVQYACDEDTSRRWRYSPIDAKTFLLINVHSGLCLTIAGGGTDRNTTAVQFPCDGDPSRSWQIHG